MFSTLLVFLKFSNGNPGIDNTKVHYFKNKVAPQPITSEPVRAQPFVGKSWNV